MNILTQTADGSNTLYNETIGEHYHSKHGALQESKHVFIKAGLEYVTEQKKEISILEVGFGTGLNYILTLDFCLQNKINLNYTSLEAFPLKKDVILETGYKNFVSQLTWDIFFSNYEQALNNKVEIDNLVSLEIPHQKLETYQTEQKYDLVYYDAFSVQHQPEMWSDEIIAHTCSFIKPGGTFVTYAITGKLKRALKSNNFKIEKLPGAPGKREMLRATKNI
jgi:tRNA U34 5-methylaminomethyl-2-thiouridine-forming methyltransferase MnmC